MIEAGPLRPRNDLMKPVHVPWLALSVSAVLAAGGALMSVSAVPYSRPAEEPPAKISKSITAEPVKLPERPKSLAKPKEYVLGAEGWSYERFGEDVVVLRAGVTDPTGSGKTGLFVISCDGGTRSLRIKLTEFLQVPHEVVQVAFRARAGQAEPLQARGRLEKAGLLNATEFSSDLIQFIERSPEGVEMLISEMGSSFSFTMRNVASALSSVKEFQRSCPA